MSKLLLTRVEEGFKTIGFETDKIYLVAYSGGPDSTFLLSMLDHYGYRNVLAVYINYKDSPYVGQEERIVKDNLQQYHLNGKIFELKEPIKGGNFEDKARKLRYMYFAKLSKDYGASGVITAHQKDDDLCTYLMQKERKAIVGHYGLSPVSEVYGVKVFRPFLDITKQEMTDYLNYNHITFYDDITNKNYAKTRNRYRDIILPTLDWNKLEEEKREDNLKLKGDVHEINPKKVMNYDLFRSWSERGERKALYTLIKAKAPEEDTRVIEAGINLAMNALRPVHSTRATEITPTLSLYRNSDGFYIMKTAQVNDYEYTLPSKGKYQSDLLVIDLTDLSKTPIRSDSFPLTLRNARRDDVFGTGIVNDSVYEFLKKQKVPQYLRDIYPLIADHRGKIIYVPFYDDMKNGTSLIKFRKFRL